MQSAVSRTSGVSTDLETAYVEAMRSAGFMNPAEDLLLLWDDQSPDDLRAIARYLLALADCQRR